MNGFNRVILAGNLTRQPELKYTPSGTPVVKFALALNRKYKQGESLKEEVTYVDITTFGKAAENCGTYLNKGDGVLLEGRIQQQRWEADDGTKRSKHEVVADHVTFLPKGQGGKSGAEEDAYDYS